MVDPADDASDVTGLLNAARRGDPDADRELMTAIHHQLRSGPGLRMTVANTRVNPGGKRMHPFSTSF